MTALRTWLSGGAVAALVAGSALLGPAVAFADESAPTPVAVDATPTAEDVLPATATGDETYTISPKGPWTPNQEVTISTKGWGSGDLLVVLTCPKGVFPAANPPGAGCGAFTAAGGAVGSADSNGTKTFTVKIVQGAVTPADASKPFSCKASGDCTIGVYGTDVNANKANTAPVTTINYVGSSSGGSSSGGSSTGGASSGGSSSGGSSTGSASSGGSSTGGTSASGGGEGLANTGATTTSTALVGLGVLVLGAFLSIASRRLPRSDDAAA